jgi:hypothetical protein
VYLSFSTFFFSVFLPYSRSYSVQFSFSMMFRFSRHIPGDTVFVSPFPRFSVFLTIFLVLQCAFLIFYVFQGFFRHIPSPLVCFSYFPSFLVFSPKSRSYSVHFSFFTLFSVSIHILVLQCAFLISYDFQFSPHIPGPTVSIFHFPRFSVFLAIF